MSVTFLTNEDEIKYVKTINGCSPDAQGNIVVSTDSSSGSGMTDDDKKEIVNSVLDALPTWTGGSY